MAPTASERKAKENELKRNVEMTEHKEDLGEMEKRLGTNYETVSEYFVKHARAPPKFQF